MYVFTYVCMYVCMYLCVCVCVCVRARVRMKDIYIDTERSSREMRSLMACFCSAVRAAGFLLCFLKQVFTARPR